MPKEGDDGALICSLVLAHVCNDTCALNSQLGLWTWIMDTYSLDNGYLFRAFLPNCINFRRNFRNIEDSRRNSYDM